MAERKTRPCFACGKRIDTKEHPDMPTRALIFESRGNYGSTIFDNDGGTIRIYIHDACFVKLRRRGVMLYTLKPTVHEKAIYRPVQYRKRGGIADWSGEQAKYWRKNDPK